jgi:putative membrane protein
MSSTRPANEVTELARERNRQAAERTMIVWINVALLLIGFGVVIEEIPAILSRSLPQNNPFLNLHLGYLLGLGTIAYGVLLLLPVAIVHRQSIKTLERTDYLTQPAAFNLSVVVSATVLFGLVALVNVILVISQQ